MYVLHKSCRITAARMERIEMAPNHGAKRSANRLAGGQPRCLLIQPSVRQNSSPPLGVHSQERILWIGLYLHKADNYGNLTHSLELLFKYLPRACSMHVVPPAVKCGILKVYPSRTVCFLASRSKSAFQSSLKRGL